MNDRWLERYCQEALPRLVREFQPERVLFFGSRVKGNASAESDVDVIVISDAFEGMSFLDRMPLVMNKVEFPKHVDYLCYTPEEYERIRHESSVLMDAEEYAVEVA